MEKPVRSSFQYLSISYECALAIGNSLNLPEMLREVIHTMVHKTNAHRGIIWVKNQEQELQPVANAGINIEDVLEHGEIKDLRDVFNQIQKRQQFVLRYKDDIDFFQYCPVLTGKEASVLIVPVTNVAILYLVYASREIADEPLANLLASLSKKLSVAIEACTAHENVIKEIQVREKAEKELTKKTEQLVSSQKELQGLYGESEQARKSLLSILEDVTQKEEALKESESKLNSILSSIDDLVFVFDQEDRFIIPQDSPKEQLYTTPDEFIGKKPSEVMPSHLNKIFSDAFDKIKKGDVAEYDYWLKIGGKTLWFSAKHTPRFIDGELMGSVAVVRDITEHKQAGEALRIAHENTKTILDKAPFGVVVIDRDRKIKKVNDTALKMAGVENADIMLGKNCGEYLCPAQQNECPILDKGQQVDNSERIFRRKDGKEIPIIKTVSEINMDGEDVLLETFVDISERKQAEKMEAAYTDMLTISNKTLDLHIIITEGLDSLIKYTDAQAGAVYLYDPDSKMMVPNVIVGMEKKVAEQKFSYDKGIVGEAAQKQEMIVVTSIPADTIYTIKSGSNHIIPATIISTPMIFKGTLLGVVVTCHSTRLQSDILSFIKRVVDQYAVALNNANTLIQVQDMAASLKNQRDELEIKSHELEAASKTKSEFLANMSHELRTPLNSIIGFSEILHDGTFGPLNEKQTKYTSNVLTSGKHLLELINGILDLAKVEAGKMELICEDFNVFAVIDESIMLLSSVASKKNIVLSTTVDKEFTTLHADVGKFKQILYNLMSNAIKFTPVGGSVTIEAHRSGDMGHIAVSDTGIGISKEEQDKLFQPFMQVDASSSRQYQGTGLGLSLVKRFVEMHGGRVWVKSKPDKGSAFTFTIPIKKD